MDTIGSYYCACDAGFELMGDGLSCRGNGILVNLPLYFDFLIVLFYTIYEQ